MNISKKEKKIAIQACINSYGGEHGKVIPVFTRTIPFQRKNVQGHFGFVGNKMYIVFEGSDGGLDWRDNFKFHMKTMVNEGRFGKRTRAHAGFLKQYRIVREMIMEEMELWYSKMKGETLQIIVTGHSLGGALATLCALDLQTHSKFLYLEAACITFGSPRVGNRHFAKVFNKRVKTKLRYQYGQDLVCGIPLVLMGYWHVDRHVRLNPWPWYNILLAPLVGLLGNPVDHYPEKYKGEI